MVYYIYSRDKLIGKDYMYNGNGKWLHRWFDDKSNSFERGSWRGRCEGKEQSEWKYIIAPEELGETLHAIKTCVHRALYKINRAEHCSSAQKKG